MKSLFILIYMLLVALIVPQQAMAQNALVSEFLEQKLSVSGQTVKVTDLQGALSGDLTIGTITIADDAGVWFQLEGGRLNWSRSALLTGSLNVQDLSAQRITILRSPNIDMPAPPRQSGPITIPQLPDLPIAAKIDRFAIKEVVIANTYDGGPLLGTSTGHLTYGDGVLDGALRMTVTNGRDETLNLTAQLTTDDRLTALLRYSEGAHGAVARGAGFIHNAPLQMTIQAKGQGNTVTTEIALETGQTSHVTGKLNMFSDDQGSHVTGTVSGDLSTLVDAPLSVLKRAGRISLSLDATRTPDNATQLREFTVQSDVIALDGSFALDPVGWPTALDIRAAVQPGALAQDLAQSGFDQTDLGQGTLDRKSVV